jgi:hypothetical protein
LTARCRGGCDLFPRPRSGSHRVVQAAVIAELRASNAEQARHPRPEHLGGQLLGLGEGLGPRRRPRPGRGRRRPGRRPAGVAPSLGGRAPPRPGCGAGRGPGRSGPCLPSDLHGERNGCSRTSLMVGAARLGGSGANRTRVDRTEPSGCGAEQRSNTAGRRIGARQVDLLRQGNSFSKHRQATYHCGGQMV